MQRVQELTIDTAAGPLAATQWGDGEPVAVLLHSGVTDRRSWADVAARQATGPLLAYDRRGFGDTAPAAADDVADLGAVLDAATSGPVWLVGNSQGGSLALRATLADPARVAGLVLLAPSVPGAPPRDPEPDVAALGTLIDAAWDAGDIEEIVRLEAWRWLDGPREPEGRVAGPARDLFAAMMRTVAATELAAGDPTASTAPDVWSQLGAITVPTVLAAGQFDLPQLVERTAAMAALMPSARYVPLPGTAHLPGVDAPGAVARLLAEAVD